MNFIFYNHCHNGDVFAARTILNLFHLKYPFMKFVFLHKNPKGILKDLEYVYEQELINSKIWSYASLNTPIIKIEDDIYINTWYGQNDMKEYKKGGGAGQKCLYYITKNILSSLEIDIEFDESDMFVDFNFEKINKPIIEEDKTNVLISNGIALSSQSSNINFNNEIIEVANLFPNINFYVGEKFNSYNTKNIIFTEDITFGKPDLVENGYISTKCQLILGRASGVYSFALQRINLFDPSKTFICISNSILEGIWGYDYIDKNGEGIKAKYVWLDSSNEISVNEIKLSLINNLKN